MKNLSLLTLLMIGLIPSMIAQLGNNDVNGEHFCDCYVFQDQCQEGENTLNLSGKVTLNYQCSKNGNSYSRQFDELSETIQLDHKLKKGIYYYNLRTDKKKFSGKIVKM